MSDWVILGAKVAPSVKEWVAEFALGHRITMSEVVRRAIEEYLAGHSESDDEVTAAETMKRKRQENIREIVPKDQFDYLLFPDRVKEFVYTVKSAWERDSFLTKRRYDYLIGLVEVEIDVIRGNPHEELLTEMLEEIIDGLRKEQALRDV